jgi:hypothetical protein
MAQSVKRGGSIVPVITKAWIGSVDRATLEAVLALSRYNRQAVLLFAHTDEWFHIVTGDHESEADKREAFMGYFIPYYHLWASCVYVVHEGLRSLDVSDAKLDKLRVKVDVDKLRRFRNATFHFQPKWKDVRHTELIQSVASTRELFERQDILVGKMVGFVRFNPHAKALIL